MTVIRPNSISGVTSITAHTQSIEFYKSDGTLSGANLDGVNINTAGILTAANFKSGTTNVHNVGVEAAGINVLGGDTPIGVGATIYNSGGAIFAGTSGVVTATAFHGDGSQLSGISAGVSLANGANNRVVTATGANAITGESTLTFDGSTLAVTGASQNAYLNNNILKFDRASYSYIDQVNNSGSLVFRVTASNTIALRLDSSAQAHFGGTLYVPGDIVHDGDTDTKISFDNNEIDFEAAGGSRLKVTQYATYVQAGHPLAFLATSGASPNMKSGGTDNQDLLFTTGSGNPTRLQIASNGAFGLGGANYGTSGQVLTSQGSGSPVQWASVSASGTIVQTIKKRLTSTVTTTSGSYQNAFQQAITLTNSSNKVRVTCCCDHMSWSDRDRRAQSGLFHTNLNSSNQFTYGRMGEYRTGDSNSYSYGGLTHVIVDTPGTSSRTYVLGFFSIDGTHVRVRGDSNLDLSYMILEEISV